MGEEHPVTQQRCNLLVVGHLRALIPGQSEARGLGKSRQYGEECVADGLGGAVDGQVHQPQVAVGAVDQGGDGGLVLPTDDEVSLPVTDAGAVQGGGRPMFDQQRGSHEAAAARVSSTAPLPQRSASAKSASELAAKSTSAAAVERLVDRLVADVPRGLVGIGLSKPGGNLLRAPILFQLGLDSTGYAGGLPIRAKRQPPRSSGPAAGARRHPK